MLLIYCRFRLLDLHANDSEVTNMLQMASKAGVAIGSLSPPWCTQVAMNRMGNKLNDNELRQLIATADVDGNGTIDYEEFVAATVNLNKLEKEEHCMEVITTSVAGQTCACTQYMWHGMTAQLLLTTSAVQLNVCSTGVRRDKRFIASTMAQVIVRLFLKVQIKMNT